MQALCGSIPLAPKILACNPHLQILRLNTKPIIQMKAAPKFKAGHLVTPGIEALAKPLNTIQGVPVLAEISHFKISVPFTATHFSHTHLSC